MVMILHGKKRVLKPKGWVAEYCPVCREPRSMQARLWESYYHVYFVRVGQRKTGDLQLACGECGVFLIRPSNNFPAFSRNPSGWDLIASRTNPMLNVTMADAAHAELEASRAEPGDEARLDWIAGIVSELAPWAYSRAQRTASESLTAVLTLLMIFSIPVAAVMLAASSRNSLWVGGTAATLVFVTVWRTAFARRRAAWRVMQPRLVPAVEYLAPTDDEFREVWKSWLDRSIRRLVLYRRGPYERELARYGKRVAREAG